MDFIYFKFVEHKLKASHRHHVYNYWLINNISYRISEYGYNNLSPCHISHVTVLHSKRIIIKGAYISNTCCHTSFQYSVEWR